MPPVEDRDEAYHVAVNNLVNPILLNEFLVRMNIPVPPGKVEERIDQIKGQLQKKSDLPTFLLQTGTSLDELRSKIGTQVRWMEYYKVNGTDATLRKFLNDNRDRFSRTRVRASHIWLKLEPNASRPTSRRSSRN